MTPETNPPSMRPYGRQLLICEHGDCAPPEAAQRLAGHFLALARVHGLTTLHGPQAHATARHATPVPCEAPDRRGGAMPLIDRIGMENGTQHSVEDGWRWVACGRSWLLRTTNPGAAAPEDEEG